MNTDESIQNEILTCVSDYYTKRINAHGSTPAGVDWKDGISQYIRFDNLLRFNKFIKSFSLCDYGCGYGALYRYLQEKFYDVTYVGYDICAAMIEQGQKEFFNSKNCIFTQSDSALTKFDYCVSSGIFNVKQQIGNKNWLDYILKTLARMNEIAICGLAANFLSSYSDKDKQRSDLYYADPCYLFDYCKKHFSRNVRLLHDYDLYEFTLLVQKQ